MVTKVDRRAQKNRPSACRRAPSATHEPKGMKRPKKAALPSRIGSAVECCDFFLYGTAGAGRASPTGGHDNG
jgi:hypothetical protein